MGDERRCFEGVVVGGWSVGINGVGRVGICWGGEGGEPCDTRELRVDDMVEQLVLLIRL